MLPCASKSVKLYPNFNPTQEVSKQNNIKTNQSYIVAPENLSTSTSHQDPKHTQINYKLGHCFFKLHVMVLIIPKFEIIYIVPKKKVN